MDSDKVIAHPKGHENLPPAYFQIDGMDPLRDEALIYATILEEESGVKTKVDVYSGLPHGHWVSGSNHHDEMKCADNSCLGVLSVSRR